MFIKTKYMIPMLRRSTSESWQRSFKLIPRQETCTANIENWNAEEPGIQVKFRHVIFERLISMYGFRENYEIAADTMLRTLMHAFEMSDKEVQERVAKEKTEHEAVMTSFFESHAPVLSRPRKVIRSSATLMNKKRNVQVRAVFKAKVEHF